MKLKALVKFIQVKRFLHKNNLIAQLPNHLLPNKKNFFRDTKTYLNQLHYFFFYTARIDEACYIGDLYLKYSFDEHIAYNYFQSLLLSSPKTYNHKKYLDSILEYTDARIAYPGNKIDTSKRNLDPNKKLKVGYICHFFSNNISQLSLWEWVRAHDKNVVDAYVLSDDRKANCVSNDPEAFEEFKKSVNFVDTSDLDVEGFCKFVRDNEFDVVLELNGHGNSRYSEINQRIAPVQISFYNISGPSGIRGIDYIFYEPLVDVSALQNFYTEKFFPLGHSASLKFANYYPEVYPAAFKKNGYITFGSFGAAHKIHIDHFKLWCKILKLVPESRFFLKASVLGDAFVRKAWEQHFLDEGISLDRVRIEGFEPHEEMLKKYADVDIALDTFPHGAGSTTNDCLYMGVPVIALDGERLCSQHGKMIIGSTGHLELIAKTEDEYVSKAVELANDKDRILQYRNSLRKDFLSSQKSDNPGFVRALERAYRNMWLNFLKQQS